MEWHMAFLKEAHTSSLLISLRNIYNLVMQELCELS